MSRMLVNDRVVLTRTADYPTTWIAGWCYDQDGSAFLAARAWDPDTEEHPAGFKKLAFDGRGSVP